MRSRLQLVALLVLVALFLLRESQHEPGSGVDATFQDWLIANSERAWKTSEVAVITISDAGVEKRPWPWSPLDFALFVQAALAWQPAVIGIEPVLAWNEGEQQEAAKHRQYLRILQDYLRRAPKVLLGANLGFPEDADVIPPLQEVPLIRQVHGDVRAVAEFTFVEHQPKEELRLGAAIGFTNTPPDREQVREAPLLFRYRGQVVPSFALQAMMLSLQLTSDDVRVDLGREIDLGGKLRVPIDRAGNLTVNFAVPIVRHDLDDLILAVEQTQTGARPVIDPESLRGKLIVLIRADAAARTLRLSGGRAASGGELIAAALATMQSGSFVREAPAGSGFGLLAAVAVLAWFAARWKRGTVLWIGLVASLGYVIVAIGVAKATAIALPLLVPLGSLLFLCLARLIFGEQSEAAS